MQNVGKRCPISILILGWLYIVVGFVGLAYHASDWKTPAADHWEIVWVSAVRALAIVFGAFMLRGKNWARWAAVGWMAFHVVISFWMGWVPVVMHSVFLVGIGVVVTRTGAKEWFEGKMETTATT